MYASAKNNRAKVVKKSHSSKYELHNYAEKHDFYVSISRIEIINAQLVMKLSIFLELIAVVFERVFHHRCELVNKMLWLKHLHVVCPRDQATNKVVGWVKEEREHG